jgi:hypothetical protein
MRNSITKGSGKRQQILLLELEKQGIISQNFESKLWTRGALACIKAKDLLLKTDKTIDEQINELEPVVLRLEEEARTINATLKGSARIRLDNLKNKKHAL